ncbi:DNA-binding transcriptional regulator YiaG [Desulfosalsimonas propionicica]|uniref:DNA-binding transcriptional regulator YiaG n=1 Tax=Desulfosalsimonas propionicica TaxID=332175 RepID=A0A7W0C7F4_9BACT|nr:helix-turn-helix domain-containing protein [Desulfosalsimonas propionicica]MBA2880571.1 DNA-binding transcriptional regulator YiaG [Desulfosalsimonas propionicica]
MLPISTSNVACTAAVQQEIADQFRRKTGLLTSRQIQTLREVKKMAQQALAERLGVDAAVVRHWEKANIQSQDMDQILRNVLK